VNLAIFLKKRCEGLEKLGYLAEKKNPEIFILSKTEFV
jgi:hypothetical protein